MTTEPNAKETDSVGVSSPPAEPDHWMLSTYTSLKVYLINSTGFASPPAFVSTQSAPSKCLPRQHWLNNEGLETSNFFMMLKLLIETLPAAAPEPVPIVVGLLAPQLKLKISIQPALPK